MPVAKADLHIHTRCSDGMASIEQVLEFVERQTGLDVIAITDHEDARGGLRARELAAKRGYRFEVVAGAEITTLNGHLLGLFLESTPKSFRRVERTLEAIHSAGGLAIAPHPLSWTTRSLSKRTLDRLCAAGEPGITFDAIELANPSPAGAHAGRKAARHNASAWRLPATGGSDAHHLKCVGTGWTEFPGKSAEDLRAAILEGTVAAGMTRYPSLLEVGLHRVAMQLAWGYSATPRKILGGSRGHGKG
ncbi:MAG: PHP domain-containing protein [Chloroflexi bacterium CFX7]|nr:PHP domain-containing protein [Chloroflexi bacterium CFX7]MCK6565524.1 PHP domain-containing protein [Dehalococcoidia bacterium]RIL01536.1 MAG: phosphotransferase [bacterium]